jgi:hypothetical protein
LKHAPGDFHSRTNCATFLLKPANLKVVVFPLGGSLLDVQPIIGFADSFSFITDCHFLRTVRIHKLEQYAGVPGVWK